MGLLAFKRDVEAIRTKTSARERELTQLMDERIKARQQIAIGRTLLEISNRLEELEERLMIDSVGHRHLPGAGGDEELDLSSSGSNDSDDESHSENAGLLSSRRLSSLVQQYVLLKDIISEVGPDHPFLCAQEGRMVQVRNTLLLDLGTALKRVKTLKAPEGQKRVLQLLQIYREMDEPSEAVAVFKEVKP